MVDGQTFSHYQVLARLGGGGMGVVYRARDLRLGRDVAIKFVNEQLTQDGPAVDRFEREARAVAALNHPNIVTIHDLGQSEFGRFIVMELVEGRTLRQLTSVGVTWETAADVGRQMAKALAAAHAAGIVHRDVKPENVMVRSDGFVKVLDFGLARLLPSELEGHETTVASATGAGMVLGTLRYMIARLLLPPSAADLLDLRDRAIPRARPWSASRHTRRRVRGDHDGRAPCRSRLVERDRVVGRVCRDAGEASVDGTDEFDSRRCVIDRRVGQGVGDDHARSVDAQMQLLPAARADARGRPGGDRLR